MLEPLTGEPYNRDPRSIAKKAAGLVKSMGVGDTIFFGPEAEFFIFDDVRYSATPYNTGYRVNSIEFPTNSDTEYEGGNLGHHIGFKKGYFPVPPLDTAQDMRSEMLAAMAAHGDSRSRNITMKSARRSTSSACSSRRWCGWRIRCRSISTASSRSRSVYGKTATFMPKPIYGDNGSGMHCHQSIWNGGKPLFAGTNMPTSRTLPAIYRRHSQARPRHQRLHQSDDELLQAAGAGVRSPGAARLLGAQPFRRCRIPLASSPRASAWRSAIRTRCAIRISASPPC